PARAGRAGWHCVGAQRHPWSPGWFGTLVDVPGRADLQPALRIDRAAGPGHDHGWGYAFDADLQGRAIEPGARARGGLPDVRRHGAGYLLSDRSAAAGADARRG